ncbi:MAG TPA: hypothetical protein VJU01_08950 [Gaiellaceae bacterium]|nr:hypothetical protein [Gaiellaceae bacterium]
MRRGLLVVAAVAALLAVPVAYALLSQHGVKTTPLYEQLPAASADGSTQYFAWSQNSRAHRNHFDAFLTRTGDPRVKLNAKGQGYVGGIDPPMVAYQQVVNGNSDVKLYDADAQTRTDPPAGVNTFDWEWEPSISGDWLLFGRQTSSTQFVILRSLTTATEVILDQGPRFRHAGQVNGDYAVWTRCTKATCNVVRRQISTVSDTPLSKPSTKLQYGAAVTGNGIVYVARSGAKCGADVKIVRYFGVGDPAGGTIVADLGTNGRDFWSAYARDNDDGSIDLFYDRYLCGKSTSDVYRLHDPHPGP